MLSEEEEALRVPREKRNGSEDEEAGGGSGGAKKIKKSGDRGSRIGLSPPTWGTPPPEHLGLWWVPCPCRPQAKTVAGEAQCSPAGNLRIVQ